MPSFSLFSCNLVQCFIFYRQQSFYRHNMKKRKTREFNSSTTNAHSLIWSSASSVHFPFSEHISRHFILYYSYFSIYFVGLKIPDKNAIPKIHFMCFLCIPAIVTLIHPDILLLFYVNNETWKFNLCSCL